MSRTKEFALQVEDTMGQADLCLYGAIAGLRDLSNLAWLGGDDAAVWAPDVNWLTATRDQLAQLQAACNELEAAQYSIRARVSVNN